MVPIIPIISPIRKTKANSAQQNSTVQKGVPSLPWKWISSRTASSWNQNSTGPRSRETGTLFCSFPTSKVYWFIRKGEKTFCPPAEQLGCFTKVLPLGEVCSKHLPFPVQNIFPPVFRRAVLLLPNCCTQGTLWQPNKGSSWPCKKAHHLLNLQNVPSVGVTHSDPSLQVLDGPHARLQTIHPSSDLGSG